MLIRASIENFLSFNRKVEILLTPGRTRSLKHHVYKSGKSRDIDVLKSSIFYGANASGKSNLIKAIYFLKRFILDGPSRSESINYQKFKLDAKSYDKDSKIELEFKYQNQNYAYGIEFNHSRINEEWLYIINKETEYKIFERKSQNEEVLLSFDAIKLSKEELKRLSYIGLDTKVNEPFLHSSNKRNIKNINGIDPIVNAYKWFKDCLTIIFPESRFSGMEVNIDSDTALKEIYKWFLTKFKTGIVGLETVKVDFFSKDIYLPEAIKEEIAQTLEIGERAILSSLDNIRYVVSKKEDTEIEAMKLMTKHKMKNEDRFINFEINEESDGTQRIMDLIPALMEASKDERVFMIDEIERSLHPNLSYKMFELFFNESSNVPSQLICTTHEDNFMNLKLFRKDEIWFIKKNRSGESTAYSLEEFKPRKDKDIRTGYLKGRFDAVPMISNLNQVPWKS